MDVLRSKIRALTAEYAADDWDGYGAKALDPKSRSAALRFVGRLPQSALSPDVCVDTDGEIYLEWKPRRGCYCSVTLSGDGRYHCLVKDGVRKTLCTTNVADEALAHVVRITLKPQPSKISKRHANIIGWKNEKVEQQDAAQTLAENADVYVAPDTQEPAR